MSANSRLCLKMKGHTLPFSFLGLCRREPHSGNGEETREKEPGLLTAWSLTALIFDGSSSEGYM